MNQVHNERVKLFAALLNALAIATIVGGCILPAISLGYDLAAAPAGPGWWRVALACLAGGGALHLGGRFALGGLR